MRHVHVLVAPMAAVLVLVEVLDRLRQIPQTCVPMSPTGRPGAGRLGGMIGVVPGEFT